MQLRNKSHEIKKFHQVLKGHVQLFFIFYFQFSKEVLQNGRNIYKNGQNSTFLKSGDQNMTLRNTSHEIKKFFHILQCHLNQYGH